MPSNATALGKRETGHFSIGAAASRLTSFQSFPVIWKEDSAHFKDTVECMQLMGQHGWLGW